MRENRLVQRDGGWLGLYAIVRRAAEFTKSSQDLDIIHRVISYNEVGLF